MTLKPDIKDSSCFELKQYLEKKGQKPFRAKQIFGWLYKKNAESFEDMTDLSVSFRKQLEEDFSFSRLKMIRQVISKDQSQKFLFGLEDGRRIETAVIPTPARLTVCVSTQVGCKYQCRFCASGIGGWRRNLSCAEILSQILYLKRRSQNHSITNIVFMGLGEPLDNYDHVLKAVRIINSSEGMELAARRITISTCGLIPQICRLSQEGLQIELAVSLHGYDNASRLKIMPVSRRYSFDQLIEACREYREKTKRQVTFEYVLIRGSTWTPEAVPALGKALGGWDCKVNLIPYNDVSEFSFESPTQEQMEDFKKALIRQGIPTIIRTPRGRDVGAACGQLRGSYPETG